MVTITLSAELEKAVREEAAQKGTTAELLTLDVLQGRFLKSSVTKELPTGATLADYIGAVDTREKYPEGSTLSENTGRKFGQAMVEKRKGCHVQQDNSKPKERIRL